MKARSILVWAPFSFFLKCIFVVYFNWPAFPAKLVLLASPTTPSSSPSPSSSRPSCLSFAPLLPPHILLYSPLIRRAESSPLHVPIRRWLAFFADLGSRSASFFLVPSLKHVLFCFLSFFEHHMSWIGKYLSFDSCFLGVLWCLLDDFGEPYLEIFFVCLLGGEFGASRPPAQGG